MIDILASERHFIDHALPVWRSLDESLRGSFLTADPKLIAYLESQGVAGGLWRAGRPDHPILVASIGDCNRTRRFRRSRVAYMEHGAGQSYGGDQRTAKHPSYAGGEGRDHVSMILAPNEMAAKRWRGRYPNTPVHVIGATRALPPPDPGPPTLAISFHWAGSMPEMHNALPHYKAALLGLARRLPIIGHGHPRFAPALARVYQRAGIEFVPRITDVARRATVYAVDNSSTLYELGRTRPVIALNTPDYRRHIHHGLRFWSHVPLQVDDAKQLETLAAQLLEGESEPQRIERERIMAEVIPYLDGAMRASTLLAAWHRG